MTLKRLLILALTAAVTLTAALALWLLPGLPSPTALASNDAAPFATTPSIRITDRAGRLLYESLPQEGGRHTVVPLEQMPPALLAATIATEDANFYTNPGVEISGIIRAAWINLTGGETLAGGSTITQQVARTLLMSPEERGERTLRRKLREAILAWQISRTIPKDEILALYLNHTYYGGLAYGVEAAAQTCFGKPAAALDLAESALIAGLPQAPGLYDPFTDLEAARARQSVVLGLMEKTGAITAEQRAQAEREPLVLSGEPYPIQAPHFVMWVRAQVDDLLPPGEALRSGGLTVVTTLDLDWQRKAEAAVTEQIDRLRREPPKPSAPGQPAEGYNLNDAALVALDPASGGIRALVGSADYFDERIDGAVNMALAPRQPGSALKPLVYADAFDPTRPNPWTPATMILDVTTHFVTHDGKAYTPANYDNLEHGPVSARLALGSSLNIPAVKALDHIGLERLFDFARRLGITSLEDPNRYDLSLALGGGEVSLLELTSAYGAFATGGMLVTPYAIEEIRAPSGEVLYAAAPPPARRVLDERAAWLVSDILSDDDARLVGFGHNSVLRLDRPAAVKTGTTTNWNDNWTVGYTPDIVVGVWAGNADREPMRGITGLTGAAPIWHQFIRTVLAGEPERWFTRPAGLSQVEVCALSGLLPAPDCPSTRLEWFITGTEPRTPDTLYVKVGIDTATGELANANTPPERVVTRLALDLPHEARPWAAAHNLFLLDDLALGGHHAPYAETGSNALPGAPAGTPPSDSAATPATPGGTASPLSPSLAMRIISPADRAVYLLDPAFSTDAQRILVRAAWDSPTGPLTLYADGAVLATFTAAPYEAWWTLAPGTHTFWAAAGGVESARITLEVK